LPGFLDADGVPNNGCELQIDALAVYVSAHGGRDTADCGEVSAPCARIEQGLDRAQEQGLRRVRVSDGVYREDVTLRAGIDLLGGHHRTQWIQDPELNITLIEGSNSGALDRRAVSALDIQIPTLLEGFVIRGASPLISGNSYGLYIRDCDDSLEIRDCRIFAGDGGRGSDGDSGESGEPGEDGVNGEVSEGKIDYGPCPPSDPIVAIAGGFGGQLNCGEQDVSGGRGGYTTCPVFDQHAHDGFVGKGPLGALGGEGGWDMVALDDSSCTVSGEGNPDAEDGHNGVSGQDGRGGDAGLTLEQILGGHWRGEAGQTGEDGQPGGSGGGGGGAAGVRIWWWENIMGIRAADFGASGGGGGSAGCSGLGGGGGGAGGGSFSIFILFSGEGPQDLQSFPRLISNELNRGLGGAGGTGGIGGGGGEGGVGGDGGLPNPNPDLLIMPHCSFQAGSGGHGGRGGHGGGGGGGTGGISYDIFVNNSNALSPASYLNDNLFGLPNDYVTWGRGGAGGRSSDTEGGQGGTGVNGHSGLFMELP